MDFGWTLEQQRRHDEILEAARSALGPEPATTSTEFRKKWREIGDLGLLGACLPVEHGGAGSSALDTARSYEALGEACADTGVVFAASAHLFACAVPIAEFGSAAITSRWLPGMCGGDHIAGNAMTETGAGSDVARLATTATPVDGGYLLNGEKSFVSNGPVADVFVTYATTDPEAGHLGQTAFVVAAEAPGVRVGEPFEKMGLRSTPASTVTFTDCLVPGDAVLGREGMGATIFQHSMGWERACLFAGYVGMMARLVDRVTQHARRRKQFGSSIGRFQAVSHRVVEMHMRLETARLLLYRACWEMDQGRPARLEVALSKLAASEGALASAMDAVRIFGAQGFLADAGIEAELRNAVPSVLFSGTSEIQRELAARELGL
ncbi:acyl-CoA dehydrogenase [Streptomyces sp. AJS327]|uniref:acyl-CoA dehydrogenase family protein n=1 Tax=Streptomyces sp. AJS327 TaxID=2545265 RepID=UPI0015E03F94|nr:acyl-CoA dehydrogenase family protein [Streptomyces sp. AJS327]MBA0053729.1 acyl-CoA dehydrogenase [Streptomyces sp. AJS327]